MGRRLVLALSFPPWFLHLLLPCRAVAAIGRDVQNLPRLLCSDLGLFSENRILEELKTLFSSNVEIVLLLFTLSVIFLVLGHYSINSTSPSHPFTITSQSPSCSIA